MPHHNHPSPPNRQIHRYKTRLPSYKNAVYGFPALRRDLLAEKARGGRGLDEKQLGGVFTAGAWSVQGGRFLVGREAAFYPNDPVLKACGHQTNRFYEY